MELEQIEKILIRNLHKPVKIYWWDPDYDWHNWVVKDIDLKSKKVILIGLSDCYEDKDEHAQFEEIKTIKALKIEKFNYTFQEDKMIEHLMNEIGYENI